MREQLPPKTVLGFDFGLKRIGIAVGNTLTKQAQPLTVLRSSDNLTKFNAIARLLDEWQPDICIVGVPYHSDGTPHEMTQRCRRFANQLHGRFGMSIELVDERYSSAVLPQTRDEWIDAQAAAIILQQYFDDQSI